MIDYSARASASFFLTQVCAATLLLLGPLPVSAYDALQGAQQHWDRGELQSAEILLKNHLRDRSDDIDAHILLARIYIDLYQGDAAEAQLIDAQSAGAARHLLLLPLTRALLLQGEFERVLDELAARELSDDTRRQAEVAAFRGDAYRGLGQTAEAEIEYDRALALLPGQVQAGLGKVRLAMMARRVEDARSLVDQVTAANPGSADAWELSAELDQVLGNYEAAEQALDKAEILSRNKLPPRFKRAIARLERGEIEGALQDIDQVEAQMPGFPGLYFARGLLMLRQGLIDRGIESLNAFLRYHPSNLRATYLIALAELQRGNRDTAAEMLQRYLDAVPGSISAGLALGGILVAREDFRGAIALLRPLVQDNPSNAELLALYAKALASAGEIEEARRSLDSAIASSPDQANLRVASAENLLRLGQADAALLDLDKAIELDPLNRRAQLFRIKVRLQQQRWAEALALAEALAEVRDGDAYVINALGLARLGVDDIAGARDAFRRALDADVGFADPAMNLAKLYLRDGDSGSARDLMQSILERVPGHVEATLALGELDAADGQPAAQRQRLADAVDAYPNEVRFRLALAPVLLSAGEPGQSLAVLQTAPSAIKDNPELLLLLGESQMALGAFEEAISIYQSLMLAAPDRAAVAQYLLARAYAQQGNLSAMIESLVRGVELEPGNALVSPITQLAFKRLKSQSEQLALADRMLRASDDDPRVIALKADLLVTLGNHEEAEALIAGLAAAYPQDLGVMRKLFAIQRAGGNKADSLETLEQWHAAAPEDFAVSLMLAQTYAEAQREDQAIALLNVLLKAQPGNAVVLNNLAWLLRDRDPVKALSYAERAHRLEPKDPAITDTLGLLLVDSGDINRGISLLDDARIASPTDYNIAFHYAKALLQADRQTEAKLILLELASKPFPEQESANALLEGLGN